jgi:hypothetical protein
MLISLSLGTRGAGAARELAAAAGSRAAGAARELAAAAGDMYASGLGSGVDGIDCGVLGMVMGFY